MKVVPNHHHRQMGTHDAEAFEEWLSEQGWLPVSLDALRADLRCSDKALAEGLLPDAHNTWVRHSESGTDAAPDRVAAGSARTYQWSPDRMKEAGWELVPLFDLDEACNKILNQVGARCRSCQIVYGRPDLAEEPLFGAQHALCHVCAGHASAAMKGDEKAADWLSKPNVHLLEARRALRLIRLLIREGTRGRGQLDDALDRAAFWLGISLDETQPSKRRRTHA